MSFSVSEVSRYAGVTVRTLHHYDEIGLLSPSTRTRSGYRRYAEAELERLQKILFYRELGFGLDQIATLLEETGSDDLDHLRRQREMLTARISRLQRMVQVVEHTMEARQMGISLNPEEMFEVFGDDDPTQYAEEAEQRWGDTDAYRESHRRTSSYSKDDWLRLKEEGANIERRMANALASGVPADSAEAMDAAEEHRLHIDRWFYPCSYEMHTGLADMYVADARFTEHYEKVAPGLAQYVHDAIHANAERART
jgi:MerR family transcriptional regulator, thiopeptide resistance regulator